MSKLENTLISASAGTGKTFQLTNRFLALLFAGAELEEVLATTFTRKAAGEILDRVIMRLANAAADEEACSALASFLNDASITRPRCVGLLVRVTRNLHRLRISTLDSFFAQIATSFSLDLGLPAGWQIVDELRDRQLRNEAITAMLSGPDGTQSVLRLLHLMTQGAPRRSVSEVIRGTVRDLYNLFQETTEEAWAKLPHPPVLSDAELRENLQSLMNLSLPTDKRFVTARQGDYDVAMRADWETFLEKGLAARVMSGELSYHKKPLPDEVVAIYEKLIGHAKGILLRQLAHQTEATYAMLLRFDQEYQRLKFEDRALRFEDVTRALADSSRRPSVEQLAFRLDGQMRHLLLDEFQDTSLVQWNAVRPFAERLVRKKPNAPSSKETVSKNLTTFFCVGDIKQAIYGWRGGRAEIFAALNSQLPGLRSADLTCSFRSSPVVIELVNRVFRDLMRHPNLGRLESGIRAWCDRYPEHSTAKRNLPGHVSLVTAPLPADGGTQNEATLRFAAERIADLVKKTPGRSVGVLTRKNESVARLIFFLRQLRVPASEEGGNPLTDSVAVQGVLSLLKLADHPGDTVARFHVATSPLGSLVGFTSHTNDSAASELARKIRCELLEKGYGPALADWVRQLSPHCNVRELARLQQLVELAFQYQPLATLRTTKFLDLVGTERIAAPASADVRVMTVHKAKGLEFDIVVLPDMDARLLGQTPACVVGQTDLTQPVDRVCLYRNAKIQALLSPAWQRLFSEQTQQNTEEAMCVLYVALTRAVHALHIVIAPSKEKEKQLPQTAAGLLRAALTDGLPVGPCVTLFELGTAKWCDGLHKDTMKSPEIAATEPTIFPSPLPSQIALAPLENGRRAGWDRIAPSSLEGGGHVRLARVMSLDSSAAMSRGTIIHAWFEQIQWLDDGVPTDDELRKIAAALTTETQAVNDYLPQFRTMLTQPVLAELLSRKRYSAPWNGPLAVFMSTTTKPADLRVEVFRERRFAVRESGRLMTGAIDRLVVLSVAGKPIAAEIIDFKTDMLDPENELAAQAIVEHYRPQQVAYRRAVSQMFHLPEEHIALSLAFVGVGLVVQLAE